MTFLHKTKTQLEDSKQRLLFLFLIPYQRKQSWEKMTKFFASDELSCQLILFLPTITFTDEYSYQHFFYKR